MKARRNVVLSFTLVSLAAAFAVPRVALAQDPVPAPAATRAAADDGGTDHARMVGRFAVGFFGTRGVDIGLGDWSSAGCGISTNGAPAIPCFPAKTGSTKVDAPVIGVRYWLNERLGIDAGIGIGIQSGSVDSYVANTPATNGPLKYSQDKTSLTAFVFHGGVPLALASAKHFTFEVIPELNVGFASGTVKDQYPPVPGGAIPTRADLKLSGFLLDIGARAGGELHFGFIGVPELSVVGTVGLSLSTRSQSVAVGGNTAKNSDTTFGTSVQATPFAIFTNNISAFYYF